jgi:hypothetical protein
MRCRDEITEAIEVLGLGLRGSDPGVCWRSVEVESVVEEWEVVGMPVMGDEVVFDVSRWGLGWLNLRGG